MHPVLKPGGLGGRLGTVEGRGGGFVFVGDWFSTGASEGEGVALFSHSANPGGERDSLLAIADGDGLSIAELLGTLFLRIADPE